MLDHDKDMIPLFGFSNIDSLFDRLHEQVLRPFKTKNAMFNALGEATYPKANVYNMGSELSIDISVPYFSKNDISISLENDTLTIVGELKNEELYEDVPAWIIREIPQKHFSRAWKFNKSVTDKQLSAELKDGILKIRIANFFPEADKAVVKKTISIK